MHALAMSAMKKSRSRETLDSKAIQTCEGLLKTHVKTLDGGHYLEDSDTVCEAYAEILEFLIPLTSRLNAATITKMASNTFEAEQRQCVAFGRAIADAFSYINGKALRFVDGSKTDTNRTVLRLIHLARKRDLKSEVEMAPAAKAPRHATAVQTRQATAASSSKNMSDAEILDLYGVQPLGSDYTEARRSLREQKSMGDESIMSINSSAPDSPRPASTTASASISAAVVSVAPKVELKDRLARHGRSAPTDDRRERSRGPPL